MDKKHKAWLYKLENGKIVAKLFEGTKKELEAKSKEGWVDSPALTKKHSEPEKHPEPEKKELEEKKGKKDRK